MAFCIWLFPLSRRFSRYIHGNSMCISLLFQLNNIPFYGLFRILFIHVTVTGFWVISTFGASMNKATMNIHRQVLYKQMISIFWGIYLDMKLLGHTVTRFKFSRNCQTVFQNSCTILQTHKQSMRVNMSSHSHQHFSLSIFLTSVILMGVKWYLPWFCISLLATDVEHFVMYYRPFVYLLWKKCQFLSLGHF